MRIARDNGHTITGPNTGAVGIIKESEETRRVGNRVNEILRDMGETVIDCTVDKASSNSESLRLRVNKANAQTIDLFVSIHFNSSNGQGHGTEVYTWKGKQIPSAKRVCENMAKLGFRNRGVKDGSHLYVIKHTKAEAMLIEVCFVDNKEDVERYKANLEKVAVAIAEGITGKSYSKPSKPSVSTNDVKDKMGEVTGNRVNVRLDPVINPNNILGQFNKGHKVKLWRLEGEWYHCYSQFNSNRMYIHKDYIKVL